MATREVYKSTTMGSIPLSFTGRHLLQSLREEFKELLTKAVEKAKRGKADIGHEWEGVSRARGRLAQYMSQLEERSSTDLCGMVSRMGPSEPNNDMVICPHCTSQFPAVPVNVQEKLSKLEAEKHPAPKTLVLPPIPNGYALHQLGGVTVIEPIEKIVDPQ